MKKIETEKFEIKIMGTHKLLFSKLLGLFGDTIEEVLEYIIINWVCENSEKLNSLFNINLGDIKEEYLNKLKRGIKNVK